MNENKNEFIVLNEDELAEVTPLEEEFEVLVIDPTDEVEEMENDEEDEENDEVNEDLYILGMSMLCID